MLRTTALYLDLYPTILNTDVLNIKKTYTLIDKMCEKRERHKKVKKKLKFKKFESNFFCCFLDIDRIINIKRRKTITHKKVNEDLREANQNHLFLYCWWNQSINKRCFMLYYFSWKILWRRSSLEELWNQKLPRYSAKDQKFKDHHTKNKSLKIKIPNKFTIHIVTVEATYHLVIRWRKNFSKNHLLKEELYGRKFKSKKNLLLAF